MTSRKKPRQVRGKLGSPEVREQLQKLSREELLAENDAMQAHCVYLHEKIVEAHRSASRWSMGTMLFGAFGGYMAGMMAEGHLDNVKLLPSLSDLPRLSKLLPNSPEVDRMIVEMTQAFLASRLADRAGKPPSGPPKPSSSKRSKKAPPAPPTAH